MQFSEAPIIVLGDIILDGYLHGAASRLSPEAPVPIVNAEFRDTKYSLGGAGNVAANIKALGGNPVLIGVIADDADGEYVCSFLEEKGMHTDGLVWSGIRTTVKLRLVANRQQIVRIDSEYPFPEPAAIRLSSLLREHASTARAIVISDYAKGVVSDATLTKALELSREYNIPIFLDPKVANAVLYRRCTRVSLAKIHCMTPNLAEAEGLTAQIGPLDEIGGTLLSEYSTDYALVTLGEHGMSLYGQDCHPWYLPTVARAVFDVSGAGDTVIAALALASISGFNIYDAARIANAAAGIVVGKPGTATVGYNELMERYKQLNGTATEN